MEPVQLTTVVQEAILSDRCARCGYGPPHKVGDKQYRWCKRCVDVFFRKTHLKPKRAEAQILALVGALYFGAKIEHIDDPARQTLLGLDYGQDVFVFGPVGTGKTYTMAALLRYYVYEGYEVERINFDDFCVKVRSAMSPASKLTEWDLIEPLKEVDKLFIDDLGLRSKQETDFAYVTFYSLLNKRQEKMLPTLVSSNKDIERLGQSFDARVASRLRTAAIIEMTGQDRRLDVARKDKALQAAPVTETEWQARLEAKGADR